MRLKAMKHWNESRILQHFFVVLSIGAIILFFASCAKKVNVYHPPRLDLTQHGRIGIITFTDNAQPSVADYASEQFQKQIHSAQAGIPIVTLGTEDDVLKRIGANQLDSEAMIKIGQQYNVLAVFTGNLVYSDIEANVDVRKNIDRLKAGVEAVLRATLSAKLIETQGGASIWSNSVAWHRKLGQVKMGRHGGVSVKGGTYHDAYQKLVPDMVHDITRDFRGYYTRERADN